MAEKCLIAASFAALVFHPCSSIKCFKSKRYPHTSHKPSRASSSKPNKELKAETTGSRSNEFSDLGEGEWPIDIVASMFRCGWPLEKSVVVEKVLKVNHSRDALSNFEEYREGVESKFERGQRVDGNELLRFHNALITCSLGLNGASSGVCCNRRCAVCRIVSCTFPVKDASITLYENSWRAHGNIDREYSVAERACARTASVICRVIAGRIANYHELGVVPVGEGGFDSVVSRPGCQSNGSEELVVLNQKAILPCFVVIYRAS